ncbi:MAG: hypothetical protein U9Q77_06615 [Candidatus Marinimicrobia bacterium]|nr:hypothetical protein [Candidatus Neomarinimicrobiota bacterium]
MIDKKLLILSLVLLHAVNIATAGEDCWTNNTKVSGPFVLYVPHLSHSSNSTSNQSGWSLKYQFPGFVSIIGEIQISKTTKKGHTFTTGLGDWTLVSEVNYKVTDSKSPIFINAIFGLIPMYDWKPLFKSKFGYLGSCGVSNLKSINNDISIQNSFDVFFHYGMSEFIIAPDIPLMRGCEWSVDLQKKLNTHTALSFTTGIAYSEYAYAYSTRSDGSIYNCHYRTMQFIENNPKNLHWDKHVLIPLGISIKYQF